MLHDAVVGLSIGAGSGLVKVVGDIGFLALCRLLTRRLRMRKDCQERDKKEFPQRSHELSASDRVGSKWTLIKSLPGHQLKALFFDTDLSRHPILRNHAADASLLCVHVLVRHRNLTRNRSEEFTRPPKP